jgi:hypothetical protein
MVPLIAPAQNALWWAGVFSAVWFANGGFVDPIRADAERRRAARAARGADHPMDEADARQNRRRNRWMRLLASLFGPRRVRHRHGGEREMGGWRYTPPRRRL